MGYRVGPVPIARLASYYIEQAAKPASRCSFAETASGRSTRVLPYTEAMNIIQLNGMYSENQPQALALRGPANIL